MSAHRSQFFAAALLGLTIGLGMDLTLKRVPASADEARKIGDEADKAFDASIGDDLTVHRAQFFASALTGVFAGRGEDYSGADGERTELIALALYQAGLADKAFSAPVAVVPAAPPPPPPPVAVAPPPPPPPVTIAPPPPPVLPAPELPPATEPETPAV